MVRIGFLTAIKTNTKRIVVFLFLLTLCIGCVFLAVHQIAQSRESRPVVRVALCNEDDHPIAKMALSARPAHRWGGGNHWRSGR